MARRIFRNVKGQFTSDVSILAYKELSAWAKEIEERIKPEIRDKLAQELAYQINASRTPATKKGQEIEEYNQNNAHKKARLYHRTGTLARSIHGRINGNVIEAGPDKNAKYEMDDTPVTDVYNYLKYGTTDTPKYDKYYFNNKKGLSPYIQQKPHDFEARTSDAMKIYMKALATKLETSHKNNSKTRKYIDLSGG